jgi:hypothetical protein
MRRMVAAIADRRHTNEPMLDRMLIVERQILNQFGLDG